MLLLVAAGLLVVACVVLVVFLLVMYPTGSQQGGLSQGGAQGGAQDGKGTAAPPGAIVPRNLADLKFAETRVFPPGKGPEIPNIQQVGPAHFKFTLRHRDGWYDGDRDGKNNRMGLAKSRAETFGFYKYVTPFELGSTWLIGSTVRLAPDFVPSRGYCNIMQPTNHQSFLGLTKLVGDTVTCQLVVFQDGIGTAQRVARTVTFKRNVWTSLVVKTTVGKQGYFGLSINGDAFQGIPCDTTKSGDRTPPLGGNFGLYGSATTGVDGKPLGDQTVEHKNMFLKHLAGPGPKS